MGWGNCGLDSTGRPIGYVFPAFCDHEGCFEKIDRGLSYVCGNMHGESEISCEKYFCENHRSNMVEYEEELIMICDQCAKDLLEIEGWVEDEEEATIVYKEED